MSGTGNGSRLVVKDSPGRVLLPCWFDAIVGRARDIDTTDVLEAPSRRSRTPQKSKIERHEKQDYSDIPYQALQELVSEERDIDTDDDGGHPRHVQRINYTSVHFSSPGR
jgi:hypothetical protein